MDPAHDIRVKLRQSHHGIDAVIDHLVDLVRPWLLFAPAQTRPRVVGLWGMTGTGKSSLVRALVRHLGLDDRTFWLDAGEIDRHGQIDEVLEQAHLCHNGSPFVLVIDEFQHARTLKGGMPCHESVQLRRLWELIDSGHAMVQRMDVFQMRELRGLKEKLRDLLRQGVVIERGQVVEGRERFARMMGEPEDGGAWWAVPEERWGGLRSMMPQPMPTSEFSQWLADQDGDGTIAMLERLERECAIPAPLDARQALIFVLGNFDELYTAGQDPLPELDPEVLVRRHRNIGNTGVHEALCELFRIEQVARLGTDHIVFPPLGMEAMRALVRTEADAVLERLNTMAGMCITATPALLDRIVRDSAIAVLGARPLVAAVHRVLPSLAAQVCDRLGDERAGDCVLDVVGERVLASVRHARRLRYLSLRWPAPPPPPMDPVVQRRLAVHEAGHLLCGVRLAGLKPLQACARTSSTRTGGFVVWERETQITRAELLPRMAGLLAGWAAERIVFGEQGVSFGCDDDLSKVAELALSAVKEQGMGGDRSYRTVHPTAHGPGFRTMLHDAEAVAAGLVRQAEELALRTLERERVLLDRLAAALEKHGSLGPSGIERLFAEHPRPKEVQHGAEASRKDMPHAAPAPEA
jgi:hypothetical protein